MSASSGVVRKIGDEGIASATVEVVPSSQFQVKSDLTTPIQVRDLEGKPFAATEIEITCMSGARYARHVFPLDRSRVIIRTAQGTIAPLDIEAFAIATVLAIGRALAQEDLIPAKAFQGASGSWEALSDD